MAGEDYEAQLAAHGLNGWRASVRYRDGYVATLVPPGQDPLRPGRSAVVRRGRDQADAFARAVDTVKGSRQ
jgi:hypothetical protein